ncbi:MAG: selB [Firmicutes bacterium]|nr:selB [Bacillota bacterium]
MKHVIIGTAGHVDHGKTALIYALTGTDTDRLKEEKRRGISIDLGFAAFELAEDIKAGFVDVPGHERFLKNMLAGTGGIDAAVLVIAADESVMPQTREHLAMLQLYGVQHGIVVINKIDKVDSEWLDLVEEEIRALLRDTFLATAPLCRVSALTGVGLEQFHRELVSMARIIPARDTAAPFRMWIDRVFVSKGHGVIATGSVLSGTAMSGDTLKLLPSETVFRVRGLEVHGVKTDSVCAGQRAAINLSGPEIKTINRGMVLTAKEYGQVSANWDAEAKWYQDLPTAGLRIRLHIGTAEYIGRIHHYKDAPENIIRLLLEKPLGAAAGDRGIIRLYSPQILIGAVSLISPGGRARRLPQCTHELAQAQSARDLSQIVRLLPAREERLLLKGEIRCMAGYFSPEKVDVDLQKAVETDWLLTIGDYYCATTVADRLIQTMQKLIGEYHRRQPYRAGIPREILRQKLRLSEREFEAFIHLWKGKEQIQLDGAEIALIEHAEKYNTWRRKIEVQMETVLSETDVTTITIELLAEKLIVPKEDVCAAYEALLSAGTLVRVGDIIVYRKTIQYIAKIIHQHFAEKPTLTVAEFRDKLNTSRKTAMTFLEYFDMHKYTIREGDTRRKGREVKHLSE